MNKSEKRDLAIVLAAAFLASLAWCLTKGREIEGDQAIIGLMALKISQGADFPIFFWKAHYSGPIASYLAAPLHWFFEPSPIVLHSVIIPTHMFYCAGMYFLARAWLGQREAMIAGLFAALPAELFPYSALGGFTESMALVPWIFLLCVGESKEANKGHVRFLWGGFLCGFALWVFPLAFPPVLACVISQCRAHGRRAVKLSLAGSLLGLLPTIYYNISHPGATLLRLLARPSELDRQAAVQLINSEGLTSFFTLFAEKWGGGSYQALLNVPPFTLSLLGFGADSTVWGHVSGLIALFALLFGLWACFRYQGKTQAIARAIALTVIITYCFLVVFGLNRARYLIPILLIVPFGLALAIHRLAVFLSWRAGVIALASLLLLNCLANFWDTKTRYPDYQGLAQFLEFKSLPRGYAPYEAAYPLVYLSNERLMYSPVFHEPKYDRYTAHAAILSEADNLGFVYDKKGDAILFRQRLKQLKTSFKEEEWGKFTVFHQLNPKVEIGDLR